MTSASGAAGMRARRVARVLPVALALALGAASLAGCSDAGRIRTEAVFLGALSSCLQSHGIAHPDDVPPLSAQERAVPILIGTEGTRVPRGVSQARFQAALDACTNGTLHAGPRPITSPLRRALIGQVAGCLTRNGFAVGQPDFSGSGPVIDVAGIDVAAARWQATVKGCQTDGELDEADLTSCLGTGALAGQAASNALFQQRILGLGACLKRT
jgi:hypothetical protein